MALLRKILQRKSRKLLKFKARIMALFKYE